MALYVATLLAFYVLLNPTAMGDQRVDNDMDTKLSQVQSDLAAYWKIPNFLAMPQPNFKNLLTNMSVFESAGQFVTDITICGICKKLVINLQLKLITPKIFAEYICRIYIALRTWVTSTFCQDLLKLNLPILEYIVNHSKILTPRYACSVILQNDNCYEPSPQLTWEIPITSYSQKKIPQVTTSSNAKPIVIIHITDVHITPDYEIGGVSNCGFPICCKRGLGSKLNEERAATWGNYDCDTPPWFFSYTMAHLNRTYKNVDLVYFTGDIIDHTVWKGSKENNSRLIYDTFKSFYDTFPNIPVLPLLGNHEPVPLNIYAPKDPKIEKAGFSTQWLYDLVSKLWRVWIPLEAQQTVRREGYYAYTVNKKFKIIALNNNICYNFNWWLLLNTTFLKEQLMFLNKELEESERNEQFVHILSHIPLGSKECIEPWEKNFNKLVKRFAHIIKGQFVGHTHTDELKLFYNEDKSEAINVCYNGASLTPYQKYNPNYKLIYLDPNTYEVLDIETYIVNLTYANEHPHQSPAYYKLYSMKTAYKLPNFQPKSFQKLMDRMFKDENLSSMYWRHYVRNGDPSLKEGCDSKCQKGLLCNIEKTYSMKPNSSPRRECT